ncbi:MAG: 1,6-anhydro-N-acetylmuramyl-L-alanine amidase AmpD [Gammaproteobacteria bacterium]
MDSQTNLLNGVKYLASSHHDVRPDDIIINLLVIHSISLPPGEFSSKYIQDFFLGKLDVTQHEYFKTIENLRVSSHALIDRSGEVIQFVPFHLRAWHAGKSSFQGRENCNDYAIGIELIGDEVTPYTDEQYKALTALTRALMQSYPGISHERIVGHSDIAPGRKTDPGSIFDWKRFELGLN